MYGRPATQFNPEARYIVIGGPGGLGRSIMWMIDRGARDFVVVLSRPGISTPRRNRSLTL